MRARDLAIVLTAGLALGASAPAVPAQADKSKAKGKRVAQAPKERHQCKVGPYEKQTRLVMETVQNKPVYIAWWSSNGPFHCSFETWPQDGRAQWVESKAGTVINLISGTMLIERNADKFYVHAREVDRMAYCGTFGFINGVLTVPKRGECAWQEVAMENAGKLQGTPSETPLELPAEPAPAAKEPASAHGRSGEGSPGAARSEPLPAQATRSGSGG